MPQFQERQYERVLARKMAIERHLGDASFGYHLVDAGRSNALAVEQPIRGGQYPFPSRQGRHVNMRIKSLGDAHPTIVDSSVHIVINL